MTYNRGTYDDQKLFGQHSVKWIEKGKPDAGKIMIFNNGFGRMDGNYSSVDIIAPQMDNAGKYIWIPANHISPASPLNGHTPILYSRLSTQAVSQVLNDSPMVIP
ncbi:MAG: hypothetical protein IPM69_15260 [Ignavibacteria bacterium]|nr:hypothetical protein [Ignavibacteria bacterium]